MSEVHLGPTTLGTLQCSDAPTVADSYCRHLHSQIAERSTVSAELAALWGAQHIAGADCILLANALGEPWLRVIGAPGIAAPEPLRQRGWMSLEVSVQAVDELAAALDGSPFTMLRPPANLALSDKIRACQVAGPAGEVLYLTQVDGEVPPFELESARAPVDRLSIPVLSCADRDTSSAFYQRLSGAAPLSFDTLITVVNQAYSYPMDRQHPVATLQWNGASLIEIDQLADAVDAPSGDQMPAGIALISVRVDSLDSIPAELLVAPPTHIPEAPYHNARVACVRGPSGERLELIE